MVSNRTGRVRWWGSGRGVGIGCALAIGWGLASAGPALAQLHNSDIVLRVEGGRVTTNAVATDPGGVQTIVSQRVFGANFGAISTTSDPGFDCVPFTFAPGTSTGFDMVQALRVWQGTSFVATTSPVVRMRFGPTLVRFTPASDVLVPGFGISIPSDGTYHRHINFALFGSSGLDAVGPERDGVYLLALRMWNSSPTVTPSEVFYIVMNQNQSGAGALLPEFDAAQRWVLDNLLGPARCNPADIADNGSNPGSDGVVDNGDFSLFIAQFFNAGVQAECTGATVPCAAADIGDNGSTPSPDGFLDNGDFSLFISSFFNALCG